MTTIALITMVVVQVSVTLITLYFLGLVLKKKQVNKSTESNQEF